MNAGRGVVMINTPQGPLSVVYPVAQQLLTQGIISGELDGNLHAADAMTVKAAIVGGSGVCDFCHVPDPKHEFKVPDFQMVPGTSLESTGGWAACDTCADLVRNKRKKDLLQRALGSMSFPDHRLSRLALEDLHAKFWMGLDAMGALEQWLLRIKMCVEGNMPEQLDPGGITKAAPLEMRREALRRELGFTDQELDAAVRGESTTAMLRKLVDWNQSGRGALLGKIGAPRPPLPDLVPHWQRALDMKFAAQFFLRKMITEANPMEFFKQNTDLSDPAAVRAMIQKAEERRSLREMGFSDDLKHLSGAQVYSFNADTIAAIREAAHSIPRDVPLSAISTPNTGAGWFWFGTPLPITTSPLVSETVHALLWAWTQAPDRSPAIVFTAYVIDAKGKYLKAGSPAPSTRFFWCFEHTFDEMIEHNRQAWQREYGPGAVGDGTHDFVMGEGPTMRSVEELSRFFAMACIWFEQRVPVLTKAPGHIERHAKKRYIKEHKLKEAPSVHVVALRKSLRVESSEAPSERQEGAREYHCRWVVKGHPRKQPCGPGRKDIKVIWIETHIAGPDDKPVKERETVFAVIR